LLTSLLLKQQSRIAREQLTAHKRFSLEGPLSGAFWLWQCFTKQIFLLEQINQCRSLAERASNKNDRQFWLKMTQRWEGLLVRLPLDANAPKRPKVIFRARHNAPQVMHGVD
jgi:hypothetical protein